MYRLYWCPRTASQAPMAALEEIGGRYQAELTDIKRQQHRSADYLRINPTGLVPTLVTPEGATLFESAAILIHLGDRHAEANLAPPPDHVLRPAYLQWMVFMAGTISTAYKRFHYPHRFSTGEPDADAIRASAVEHLFEAWRIFDDALAGRAWTLGDRFSACDIYMQMFASWFRDPEELYSRFTNIARIAAATAARPAVARAIKRHE